MTHLIQQEALLPFHIHCTCPHCKVVRQVPEQYVGETGTCGACGRSITISANATPPLPFVTLASQSKAWYRERVGYLDFCRDYYEMAQAQFTMKIDDAYWQQRIQEAARCADRQEQVEFWERLVAENIPWSVAFEYLVHHYAKERNYERAYYFCAVYFQSDRWKNPQCVSSSLKLLKTMKKIDKKLFEE